MGPLRDHLDLAGGLRSGLTDEPPWWARGAIGAFAAVVVLVTVLSAVLGVGGGAPAGTPVGPVAAGPAATGAGQPGGPTDAPGPAAAPGAAGGTGAAGAAAGEGGSAGGTPAGATDPVPGGTVALADRDGTFRQVPRAAVDAARRHGAGLLALPADEIRHHLVGTDGERVELAVSSLDGEREVRVVVSAVDGAWRAR